MSKYVDSVMAGLKARNANEPEFLQAAEEVLSTLDPVLKANPQYEQNAILERIVELQLAPLVDLARIRSHVRLNEVRVKAARCSELG